MNRSIETLSAKDVGETDVIAFGFALALAPGESLSLPAGALTCEAHAGTDAAASAVLAAPPTLAGSEVSQRVTGGVAGVMYLLRCTVDVAPSNRRLVLSVFLPVVRP